MENDITWDKLISSTKDPLSLEVAEEFIGCILRKESSRMISLPGDIEPSDDNTLDIFKVAKNSQVSLIRHILNKLKNSINKDNDIFYKDSFELSNEEIIILSSLTDKEIEEIFIDAKDFECSDNFRKVIDYIYKMTNILGEHIGNTSILKTKNPERKPDTRIYLNTPVNENGFAFLTEFIKKCIDRGILHDMKGFDKIDSLGGKDRTVIYGHSECFLDQIEILEEIAKEHPEWINEFGTPVYTGGSPKINSNKEWYSIGYTPTDPRTGRNLMQTYNDFIDRSGKIAFGSTICQFISEKARENLRIQYNKINKTNIDSKEWEDIIKQMALLSSEKSSICMLYNSFDIDTGKTSISESEFAYFLLYETDDKIKENFNEIFSKGSEERSWFVKRFKAQTEKVVSRALGKEMSPIYMNSKLASEHSKYSRKNGFRVATDIDWSELPRSDEVKANDMNELPKKNGFRIANDNDWSELPRSDEVKANDGSELPKKNGFRRATDMDLDR